MRNILQYLTFYVSLLVIAASISVTDAADSPAKNLNVEDVVKLLQNEIGEDVIIVKLKKEAKTFDLSSDQLIELKKAGASASLLKVMLDPAAGSEAPVAKPPGTSEGGDDGFWLYDGEKKVALVKAQVEVAAAPGAARFFGGTVKAYATLSGSGPTSDIRATNRNPQIGELAVPLNLRVAELVYLAKLELDGDKHRRLLVAKGGEFTKVQMAGSNRIPIAFEQVGEKMIQGKKSRLYKVKPLEALAPGEYALVVSHSMYFDFGID